METTNKVASILFSDVKGYSKITDDKQKEIFFKEFDKIQKQILNNANHFFKNTWGDALLVCSYDYIDLADIALNLRDAFKKTNWLRLGLPILEIRIGVHTQRITIYSKENKIIDISGNGVDKGARIEPIVEPNKVFASDLFYQHLKDEENSNIQILPIGLKSLAKSYGEMELYELFWGYEDIQTVDIKNNNDFDITIPKIKKEFSGLEKKEFLSNSFNEVKNYFKEAAIQTELEYPNLKIKITEISLLKFTCNLYIDDNEKHKCKIWINDNSNSFGSENQISYAENYYETDNDNSMNDWLSITDDGFELYFNQPTMQSFNNFSSDTMKKDKWNSSDTAKYLWLRFTENLNHIYL